MIKMTELNLTGKRILIRVDLNVPLQNGRVTSTKRIEAILPTIEIALKQNAAIILISHLGRPKEGVFDKELSLAPVAKCLSELLKRPVPLITDWQKGVPAALGEVVLLENSRFNVGEKENNSKLAKQLAKLCDIFVMDAFATAHRKEASTFGVAQYAPIACAGPLLISEVNALSQVMQTPARPLVAIVAGSKVSTKLQVLQALLEKVDCLIPGGGIANTFLVAQGYEVGQSLYEPELVDTARELLNYARTHHKLIPIPQDVIVAEEFNSKAKARTKKLREITHTDMILDLGPETLTHLTPLLSDAKTILWNGPVGVFEWNQFGQGTQALAKAIAHSKAYSIAGGGDTLAAIEKYRVEDDISYISTGGGAFLEFLEGKKLPSLAILEQRAIADVSVRNVAGIISQTDATD